MFAKNPVSQSILDAVNKVLSENPIENKIADANSTSILNESEKLDELSKQTLTHYAINATNDLRSQSTKMGKNMGSDDFDKNLKKVSNRHRGVSKAIIKLAYPKNEEAQTPFIDRLLNSIKENKGNQPQETFTDNNMGEAKMSDSQMKKREDIVMSMKDKTSEFKSKYGKRWKDVMYATATKMAMKEEVEELEESDGNEYHLYYAGNHPNKGMRVNKTVYKNLKSASRAVDKLDNDYGAYAHAYKKIDSSVKEEVVSEAEVVTKPGLPDEITTDMLSGRVKGGKLNSFKSFKLQLKTDGEMKPPSEIEKGKDTREKQKISTNPGPVDIKFDDKLTGPTPYSYFKNEEVKPALKAIRNKEIDQRNKEIEDFTKNVVQAKEEYSLEDFTQEEIEEFMQTEDYEQLDELSKKTLGNYIKKATHSVSDTNYKRGLSAGLSDKPSEHKTPELMKKLVDRKYNIRKAVDRLTKENINEAREDFTQEEIELDESPARSDIPAAIRKDRGDVPLTTAEIKSRNSAPPGKTNPLRYGQRQSPLNRIKSVADSAMKRMKKESMMGTAGATSESVEFLEEEGLLDMYIKSLGMNPETISRDKKIGYANSEAFLKWKKSHQAKN